MDMKTYETFDIEITEDMKDKVVEGEEVGYWTILDKNVFTE